jgi:hypothetical protein
MDGQHLAHNDVAFFFSIQKHAKRLFPFQVTSKKTLIWAYFQTESEEWTAVDKSILEGASLDGIERLIGFEGLEDPGGFYCKTDDGVGPRGGFTELGTEFIPTSTNL